jgi:RNA-directed DNA polymerase
MSNSLEERLIKCFQPEELEKAFHQYEKAKQKPFRSDLIKICMGADGISYKTFKNETRLRCEIISRRVLNDTYQFYPFREVNITKDPDLPESPENERILSLVTIRDVLVQKMLYKAVYEDVEKLFKATPELDRVSCAYRNRKSAPYAAKLIHEYIKQGFKFVLDADIVKFFDQIDHLRLITLIKDVFKDSSLASNLLIRFIKAAHIPYRIYKYQSKQNYFFHHKKVNRNSPEFRRTIGIPQGGVLSGMLANLYLYEFDFWVVYSLAEQYKNELRYVRYADDFVILLKEEAALEQIHKEVAEKIDHLKLKLHDVPKTRHLNIAEENLNFVGFKFDLKTIKIRDKNIDKFKNKVEDKLKEEPSYWTEETQPEVRLELFVKRVLNWKILDPTEKLCETCGRVIEQRSRSWLGFFSVITDTTQLHDLDKWIRQKVTAHFYKEYKFRLKRHHLRRADLASLELEYHRIYRKKPCICNIAAVDEGS